MRKISNQLFPFRFQMNILQLEGYNYKRFLSWLLRNFFKRSLPIKKQLELTFKVKVLYALSGLWLISVIAILLVLTSNKWFALFALTIFTTQPYLLYGLSLLAIKPPEIYTKKRIFLKSKNKIQNLKRLKVVGVTGSYGKSSTKELLYQILKNYYSVLRTPESFNTLLGISKVIDLELSNKYDYFVCEMGAFGLGEIKEICQMVKPRYGILTGITKQHLERFGSLKNIVKAKFELFDYVDNPHSFVFNLDDRNTTKELERRNIKSYYGYTKGKGVYVRISNIKFNVKGSSFFLHIKDKRYAVKTSLLGYSSVQNIAGATAMALTLGLSPNQIVRQIERLRTIPHRFSTYKLGKANIIDDTYSSNLAGFGAMLNTARELKGKKLLITPGVVELGKEEKLLHKKLGAESDKIFGKIVLVGKNRRTAAFFSGISNKSKVEFISDNTSVYLDKIKNESRHNAWIFLENDVTQNY
jgi:UDP-N-acetylmuramoyl-tripeptide--D-alanyl-D-alanine ligase